jgi:N-acetyl-anhydromuramyl-L-alanine amidase AmpD
VLHSTEGNYDGAVSWLCNPQARASAHIVVGARGQTTRLVPDARKAWHVAADNPDTLGIEQEGYASQTAWPDAQLETVAQWLAWWGRKYGIPLEHSTSTGSAGTPISVRAAAAITTRGRAIRWPGCWRWPGA